MSQILKEKLEALLLEVSAPELQDLIADPNSLLNQIIPDLHLIAGCSQGSKMHFEGDVAQHTCKVFSELKKYYPRYLEISIDWVDLLAAVMHDFRKPQTQVKEPDGHVRFPGHEAAAALAVPQVSKKLELSPAQEQKLLLLVADHGSTHGFPRLSHSEKLRLVRSPYFNSLKVFHLADCRACWLEPDGSRTSSEYFDLMTQFQKLEGEISG